MAYVSKLAVRQAGFPSSVGGSLDVGTAANRRIIGLLCHVGSDATKDFSAADITYAGSNTGVTIMPSTPYLIASGGNEKCRWFHIDVPSGTTGVNTLTVDQTGYTGSTLVLIAVSYDNVTAVSFAQFAADAFNNNATIDVTSALGEEVVALLLNYDNDNAAFSVGSGSSLLTGFGATDNLLAFREDGDTSVTINGTWVSSHARVLVGFSLTQGAATPNIASASATAAKHTERFALIGTAFGASPGGKEVRFNGITQSIAFWSDKRIEVIADRGPAKYGVAFNAEIWEAGALVSNSFEISGGFAPQTGWTYINVGTPNTTAANRLEASSDIASGDQVAYCWNGMPQLLSAGVRVVLYADLTFSYLPINYFEFEVWSGDAWGPVTRQDTLKMEDVYLYTAPSDANPNDVRLYDPTIGYSTGGLMVRVSGVWVAKPVKARLSGSWVGKTVKVYLGGTWVALP
jgi:hypothetical protein